MFVRDIEFVKRVNNTALPRLVWLYFGKDQLEKRRTENVHFNAMQCRFKFFPCFADWEFGEFRANSRCVYFYRTYPSEVESRAEIMDSVANYQRVIEGSIFEIWDRMYKLLKASLIVEFDRRNLRFFKVDNSSFQISDMLIGPNNFQSGVPKHCAHIVGV